MVGWSDFENNATLSMLFQIVVCRIPIPKFQVLLLPFHLLPWPQKMLTGTLKYYTHFNCDWKATAKNLNF